MSESGTQKEDFSVEVHLLDGGDIVQYGSDYYVVSLNDGQLTLSSECVIISLSNGKVEVVDCDEKVIPILAKIRIFGVDKERVNVMRDVPKEGQII